MVFPSASLGSGGAKSRHPQNNTTRHVRTLEFSGGGNTREPFATEERDAVGTMGPLFP